MIQHILFFFFLTSCAYLFALLEIQIEGSDGWASGLPTWRFEARWSRALLGNRIITGYHLYFQLFVIALLHLPYALYPSSFSIAYELRVLAFALLFWVVEDFFWFVLNPSFGLRGFTPRRAWWHAPNWWWIMPRDYWIFTPIGLGLYAASYFL